MHLLSNAKPPRRPRGAGADVPKGQLLQRAPAQRPVALVENWGTFLHPSVSNRVTLVGPGILQIENNLLNSVAQILPAFGLVADVRPGYSAVCL